MRLRPTALGGKGAAFFAVVLVLFFATPYSNLFFLLTAFLAVLGVLGATGAVANARGVEVDLVRAAPAPAGQRHEVTLAVRSGRRMPRFDVEVELELDSGARRRACRVVALEAGAVLSGKLEPLPRGVHGVTALWLRSRHPFGICAASLRLPLRDAELVAYPPPADLRAEAAAGDPLVDGAALLEDGRDTIGGLRGWRTGDALRDVHWKASARRGQPVVKELDRDAGEGMEVVLDRRVGGRDAAQRDASLAALEHSLCQLAALLLRAAEQKQPLRMRSQGHDAIYGPAHLPVPDGLRWLAAAAPLPADAPPPARGAPTSIRLPRRAAGAARA